MKISSEQRKYEVRLRRVVYMEQTVTVRCLPDEAEEEAESLAIAQADEGGWEETDSEHEVLEVTEA